MLKLHNNGAQGFSLLHGLRRLSLSSTSSSTEATHSFIDFLVGSLGLSKQQATSVSTRLNRHRQAQRAKKVSDFDSIRKANSIISFFKQNEFDQSQIINVVCYYPRVLRCKIDETLKPKINFLRELGIFGPDMREFIATNPLILFRSQNSDIVPAIQALRDLMGGDENVIFLLKRMRHKAFNRVLTDLMPNVSLLQNYGIPLELIRKRILRHPFPYLRKTKYFEDLLIRVEEKLRIRRDSPMFLYAVQLFGTYTEETIESKCQVFKSFGWTESEIQNAIRQNPHCLGSSEARIKNRLEFFMNELGYGPHTLILKVSLLTYSLEKRIIPRHRVLLILKEKGLIRKDYPLYSLVSLTEPLFVKRFVLPFEEIHEVYAECTGHPVELLTQGKADTRLQR